MSFSCRVQRLQSEHELDAGDSYEDLITWFRAVKYLEIIAPRDSDCTLLVI